LLQQRPGRAANQAISEGGKDSMATELRSHSSPRPARREITLRRKLRFAGFVLTASFQVGALAGAAPAAKFDERIKAPEAPSNAELPGVIRDYFATYARVNAESPAGIARDKAAYQQYFETHWRLQRAIDRRQPLADLSEFGLNPNHDGSYSADLAQYPQWNPLPAQLDELRDPQVLDLHADALKARGFREQDIDAIRTYVAMSPPRAQASVQELDLADGFTGKVKARMAARQKTSVSLLLAYAYQSGRIHYEQERRWAVGLLDSLDPQRQRILQSYLQEQGGQVTITPDDIEGQLKLAIDGIASGEFERQSREQRKEAWQ
jgi:hypothetical protein